MQNQNENYICILFICLLSCEGKRTDKPITNLKNSDEIYKKVSNIHDNKLTKIDIPEFIDLDTIDVDSKMVTITIKNKGQCNLTNLTIKPPCSCNEVSKYDNIMLPAASQTITVNMTFDKIGNFYQGISVYGSFYPYIKKIYIEGFRKK